MLEVLWNKLQEAVATKPQRTTHVSRLSCYCSNNYIHRIIVVIVTPNPIKVYFLHRLRKMLSFRSQICISTICGLISIATAQLGAGCPEAYGVQTYPDEKYCDRFYKVSITLRWYVDIFRYWYHTINFFCICLI